MKSTFFTVLFTILLAGCQTPDQRDMVNIPEFHVRHGWQLFVGQKPTFKTVTDEKTIARGKSVYKKQCAGCHGVGGRGDGEVAKSFGIRPADLTTLSLKTPDSYLVMQINEGRGAMPKWKNIISDQDAWDVTAYIRSINKSTPKD